MAEAKVKTTATSASVGNFLAAIEHPVRRADAETLLTLYAELTGLEPQMWGPSIIGYGSYHYEYYSGRKGEMCRAGFSPRKANLSLYLLGGFANRDTQSEMDALRAKLGKHKTGGSCLYVGKLADVDKAILRQMLQLDLAWMDHKYPR